MTFSCVHANNSLNVTLSVVAVILTMHHIHTCTQWDTLWHE